jgi:hypothetical protein
MEGLGGSGTMPLVFLSDLPFILVGDQGSEDRSFPSIPVWSSNAISLFMLINHKLIFVFLK